MSNNSKKNWQFHFFIIFGCVVLVAVWYKMESFFSEQENLNDDNQSLQTVVLTHEQPQNSPVMNQPCEEIQGCVKTEKKENLESQPTTTNFSVKPLSYNYLVLNSEILYFPSYADLPYGEFEELEEKFEFSTNYYCNMFGPFSCKDNYDVFDDTMLTLPHIVVTGADINSFAMLDSNYMVRYAKDKNHVYYEGQPIVGAKPETIMYENGVVRDNKYIYCSGVQRGWIDIPTFREVGSYYKDKNDIYLSPCGDFGPSRIDDFSYSRPPEGIHFDVPTFSYIQANYYKDKNNVYVYINEVETNEFRIVEGADPATFEFLSEEWGKDSNSVFYRGAKKAGIDPQTFYIFGKSGYVKDSNAVYYVYVNPMRDYHGGVVMNVEGADPETFEVVRYGESFRAKDAKHVFFDGKIEL